MYPGDYMKLIWSMSLKNQWDLNWWKIFRGYCEELQNLSLNSHEKSLVYETHLLAKNSKKLHCFSQEISEALLLRCWEGWEEGYLKRRSENLNLKKQIQKILLENFGMLTVDIDRKLSVGLSREMQSTVEQTFGGKDSCVVDLAIFGTQKMQMVVMLEDDRYYLKNDLNFERGQLSVVRQIVEKIGFKFFSIRLNEIYNSQNLERFLEEKLQLNKKQ
eukprot:TRINITY_DN8946_c2_g1_i1.p2 TRINITY_DN8946_c2_g1~~TRINITY_DN8946_c2_g1_i1.p2  ORF type:complete len:217 (+),score=45.17 TRINITY_DN8946_c2_g1_i1:243-893(+)